MDELDEQLSLRESEPLHAWLVNLEHVLLHQFQMLLARLLRWQGLDKLVCLDDEGVHLLGYRQHTLHIAHEARVGPGLTLVFEGGLWIDVDVAHLHVWNAVAIVGHHARLHRLRHDGSVGHVGGRLAGIFPFHLRNGCKGQEEHCEYDDFRNHSE